MPQSAIERILSQVSSLSSEEREALIIALVANTPQPVSTRRSAYGDYAGLLTPVDEFLRLKHEETSCEDKGTAS